jgi:hypothetical protein
MHLAGKAYASDVSGLCGRLLQGFPYSDAASAPPVERVLFGPAVLRRSESFVLVRGARCDAAFLVNQQCAGATGSDVNPQEKWNGLPPRNKIRAGTIFGAPALLSSASFLPYVLAQKLLLFI